MISASEARKKMFVATNEYVANELAIIEKAIQEATSKRKSKCCVVMQTSKREEIKYVLNCYGYDVECRFSSTNPYRLCNYYEFKICW